MASKYYAVRKGRSPGIYRSWAECQKEVHGYPNAEFKSFKTLEDAEAYIAGGALRASADEGLVAYVDGSFAKLNNLCAYGLVMLRDGKILFKEKRAFRDPELASMHNVAGEIAGAQRAIEWAIGEGEKTLTIAYDYAGIEKWCCGDWKANKPGTQAYQDFCKQAQENLEIRFLKVKGHSGDTYNDMADALAAEAIKEELGEV